jgi:hypothetical protein
VIPDEEDGASTPVPPAVGVAAPTVALRPTKPTPAAPTTGPSVALRGRIPAAALARGTEPPAGRIPAPPHSAAVAFGGGAGIVVEIEGDRVTLSLPSGKIVGTREQTRDLIDALLNALSH